MDVIVMENKQPHDFIFRKCLSNVKFAKKFFQYFLPQKLVEELDFSTLSQQPISLFSAVDTPLFADSFYCVELKNNHGAISLLTEHQSQPEENMALRIHNYISGFIWQYQYNNSNGDLNIPFVIASVF